MKIKLPLKDVNIDATIKDLEKESELYIFDDPHDLLLYKRTSESMGDETIFHVFINCGENKEKAIMFNAEIDQLELFATAILKKIELIRMNYSEQIKFQTDMGNSV